ncbi:MAG: hypothetical protein JWL79_3169 [Frankiales bacterium]|nr:hypothetical protein [Frankiales bacterium]
MSVRFDLPTIEDEHRPWWDAAREGRLLIQRCEACSTAFLYPRPFCPACWSQHVTWENASGRATLYTWSVVRSNDLPPFRDRVPYVAALVDLAEGPRLMTNVVECAPEQLVVGQSLELVWHQDPEAGEAIGLGGPLALPFFRPST